MASPSPPAAELRPSLTLVELTFYGVGTVVGAGIYSVIGAAAGQVGDGVWISMLLATLVAVLTALSYAELVAAYPRAGAEFHFLKHAFPERPLLPYTAGLLIVLNAAATSAAVALSFGQYLHALVALPPLAIALALLALCTVLNIVGMKESTWLAILLICIEVGGLLLLIGGGLATTDIRAGIGWPTSVQWPALLPAAALLFFVYLGFESIANLAEEAHTPTRDLPRALLLSVVVTSVIYVLVIWTALALSRPEQLAASSSPLRTVGDAIAPWMGDVLTITALFATASTALISLISSSRLLFGMARAGELPAALARLTPGRCTPWVAALAVAALSCALLALGRLEIMASISALGLCLVFTGVQVALIVLRFTQPGLVRPFRLPGTIGRVPLPAVAGTVATLILATQFEPQVYAVTAGLLGVALALRWLIRQ